MYMYIHSAAIPAPPRPHTIIKSFFARYIPCLPPCCRFPNFVSPNRHACSCALFFLRRAGPLGQKLPLHSIVAAVPRFRGARTRDTPAFGFSPYRWPTQPTWQVPASQRAFPSATSGISGPPTNNSETGSDKHALTARSREASSSSF